MRQKGRGDDRSGWYLIKVQTYNDVGPLCLLIDHFQEVNMTDVWGVQGQGGNDIQNRSTRCKQSPQINTAPFSSVDTEKIKGSSYVDDGVSRLRLRPRGKLDDLLGCLQELRHSRPRTTGSRTLAHKKWHDRPRWDKPSVPLILEHLTNY